MELAGLANRLGISIEEALNLPNGHLGCWYKLLNHERFIKHAMGVAREHERVRGT